MQVSGDKVEKELVDRYLEGVRHSWHLIGYVLTVTRL